MPYAYALIDGNSFYCSCERVPEATNDSLTLIAAATHGMRRVWRQGATRKLV